MINERKRFCVFVERRPVVQEALYGTNGALLFALLGMYFT